MPAAHVVVGDGVSRDPLRVSEIVGRYAVTFANEPLWCEIDRRDDRPILKAVYASLESAELAAVELNEVPGNRPAVAYRCHVDGRHFHLRHVRPRRRTRRFRKK